MITEFTQINHYLVKNQIWSLDLVIRKKLPGILIEFTKLTPNL